VPAGLRYRIDKAPLYRPAEGTLQARVAPGRVVGAIFTLGILAATKGLYYFPPAQAQLEPTVDPGRDLTSIDEHGTGRIEGQAFTETRGGEVRHAAGDTVTLLVDTPYVRDAVKYLAFKRPPEEGRVTSNPDLRFLDTYKRQTIADAEGHFAFENLAPGKYILSAVISWEAPGSDVVLATQLVPVVGFADVQEATTTKTLVTDWIGQRSGIGQPGEVVIPSMNPDTEKMGQRQVPNETKDR
jgi:hypothetical protein